MSLSKKQPKDNFQITQNLLLKGLIVEIEIINYYRVIVHKMISLLLHKVTRILNLTSRMYLKNP